MIPIAVLSLNVGTVIVIAFLSQRVFIPVLHRRVSNAPKPINELGENLQFIFYDILMLLEQFALFLQSLLVTIALHFATNWRLYVSLLAVALAVQGNAAFHKYYIHGIDYINTNYYSPFYYQVSVPLMNGARILGNILNPWTSGVAYIIRFSIIEPLHVWTQCQNQNWQLTVNETVLSIQTFFNSTVNFIGSQGSGDYDLSTPIIHFTGIFASLEEAFICTCADLSFGTRLLIGVTNQPSLAHSVDRFVNVFIITIRIPVQALLQFVQQGSNIFLCTQGTPADILQCKLNRPPQYAPMFNAVNDMIIQVLDYIDAVIAVIFNVFFGTPSNDIPKFSPILNGFIGFLLQTSDIVVDQTFHLIFDPLSNYTLYADISQPIYRLYNISYGVQNFCNVFGVQFTTDVGNLLASGLNITFDAVNITMGFVQVLVVEPANIPNWALNYNITLLLTDLDKFATNADNLVAELNAPIGDVVKRLIDTFVAFWRAFIYTILHIPTYSTNVFNIRDRLDLFYLNVNETGAALGNVFRQFDSSCNLTNSTFPNPVFPNDALFTCQFGNLIESIFNFVVSILSMLTDTLAKIIVGESFTQLVNDGTFNIETRLFPPMVHSIESVTGVVVSPLTAIGYCNYDPYTPPNTSQFIAGNVGNLLFDAVNATLFVVYGANAIVQTIIYEVASPSDQVFIFCKLILTFYDITIGNLVQIALDIYNIGYCLFGTGINFAVTLWSDFGWGTPGNFRAQICAIVSAVENAIQLLVDILTGNGQGVYNDLKNFLTPLTCRINLVIGVINQIFANIGYVPFVIETVGSQTIKCVGDLFSNMISCVGCLFSCSSCAVPPSCNQIGTGFSFPGVTIPDFSDMCGALKRQIGDTYDPIFYWDLADPQSNITINGSQFILPPIFSVPAFWWEDPMNGSCGALKRSYDKLVSQGDPDTIGLQMMLKNDLTTCATSYYVAFAINTVLMAPEESQRIVDGDFLYDRQKFLITSESFLTNAWTIIKFQLQKHSVFTSTHQTDWLQYAYNNNLTIVTTRLGAIVDVLLDVDFQNVNSSRITALITLYKTTYRYTIGVYQQWSNFVPPDNKKRNIDDKRFETWGSTATIFLDAYVNSPQFDPLKPVVMETIGYLNHSFSVWWKDVNYRAELNPIVARNRVGPYLLLAKITDSIERSKYNPNKKRYTGTELVERQVYPCIGDICLNCTAVNDIMDKLVDVVLQAIQESQNEINVDQNFFSSLQRYQNNEQNSMVFNVFSYSIPLFPQIYAGPGIVLNEQGQVVQVDNISPHWAAMAQQLEQYKIQYPLQPLPMPPNYDALNFNTAPIYFLNFIFDYNFLNEIAVVFSFLSNTDATDPNGIWFWIFLLFDCDFQTSHACNGNGIFNGFGLPTGVGISIAVIFVVGFVLEFIVGIGAPIIVLITVLFPVTTVSLSYGSSPFCLTVVPPLFLPIIPNCIFNDAFVIVKYFQRDCIAWENFLPGITTVGCNGTATYTPVSGGPSYGNGQNRDFVDCYTEPYDFTDGIRSIFYVIERYDPSINQFLRTTDLVLFSWLRTIPLIANALEFPFPPGLPPAVWDSCFKITSPNFLTITMEALITLFILGVLFIILFTIIALILDIWVRLIVIFTELIGVFTGTYTFTGMPYNTTISQNYGNYRGQPLTRLASNPPPYSRITPNQLFLRSKRE